MKTVPRLLRQGIWIIFNFELDRFKFGTTITACLSGITLCISVWNSRLKCANGNFVNWIDKYLDKGFTRLLEHEQSLKQRLGYGQITCHKHFKTIFCNKEVKSKHTGIFVLIIKECLSIFFKIWWWFEICMSIWMSPVKFQNNLLEILSLLMVNFLRWHCEVFTEEYRLFPMCFEILISVNACFSVWIFKI